MVTRSDGESEDSGEEFTPYLPGMAVRMDDEPGLLERFVERLLHRRVVEWRRRILWSLAFVVALVIVYTVAYRLAMATFEGVAVSTPAAFQVVIEALTTAGFGGDTGHWTTTEMNLFVVAMNLTGVVLVFLALPALVVPLFREGLEERPSETTSLTDHVIICSYTPREDVLRTELEAAGVPYVIVEEDAETVLELNDEGIEAIRGDPEATETFRAANVGDARAVVTDVPDERNVSVILTATEVREDVPIVSVAQSSEDAVYQRYAGADRVFRPREVLGRSLGGKVAQSFTRELREAIEIGEGLELAELLVEGESELAGHTLAESGLRERYGTTVVAAWTGGEFLPSPPPDFRIDDDTILLVAGTHPELEATTARTLSPRADGEVVVAGHGVVGAAVVERLEEADVPYTLVDRDDDGVVDVVGDITDRETLDEAGVDDARAVVLTLNDDTETTYAAVALEQLAPETEVLVRANAVENTTKLYRAGGEYVLALSTVTGRMLSSYLLADRESLAVETQFDVVRVEAPALVGESLGESAVGERTGAVVAAIERDGELVASPGPDETIRDGDALVVTGTDEAVSEFGRLAGSST